MANIAVQRIKREFKEVLKSEEVGRHAGHSLRSGCSCFFLLRLNESDASMAQHEAAASMS